MQAISQQLLSSSRLHYSEYQNCRDIQLGARPSLRPLTINEGELIASLGRNAPRDRERISPPLFDNVDRDLMRFGHAAAPSC